MENNEKQVIKNYLRSIKGAVMTMDVDSMSDNALEEVYNSLKEIMPDSSNVITVNGTCSGNIFTPDEGEMSKSEIFEKFDLGYIIKVKFAEQYTGVNREIILSTKEGNNQLFGFYYNVTQSTVMYVQVYV